VLVSGVLEQEASTIATTEITELSMMAFFIA
jgi:hypothetical protein